MSASNDKLQQRLALLRKSYRSKLPDKQASLEELLQAYLQDASKEHLSTLRNAVHKLKGSGATYGFQRISDKAKEVEMKLVDMINQRVSLLDVEVEEGIRELQAVLQQIFEEEG
jgi:chemotaxis protein histidine kinase CheA